MAEPVQIDIDKVVKSKFRKGRGLPGFIVNYLKRIIHQDEINEFLRKSHGLSGVDFTKSAGTDLVRAGYRIKGIENIPKEGRHIFVSNHPLGGLDGILLISLLGDFYDGKIKAQVNDLLMNITPMAPVFIPVNSYGRQTRDLSRDMAGVFDSDDQILVFPAGLCSRRINGVIQDPEWKKWFVTSAVQYHRDVVPVYFDGRNSNFFYRFAFIRKMLGIKFNIELMYLPDEMFKMRHKTFDIYFGKPIPWQSFNGSKTPKEWAQDVRRQVYELKNKQ